MTNATYVFLLKIKTYFYCLWMAVIGRTPYLNERKELSRRIDAADEKVKKLEEMYNSALEQWQQTQNLVKQMEDRDVEKVATYQKLVETLRSTINDKEHEIDKMNREFGNQLRKLTERKNEK